MAPGDDPTPVRGRILCDLMNGVFGVDEVGGHRRFRAFQAWQQDGAHLLIAGIVGLSRYGADQARDDVTVGGRSPRCRCAGWDLVDGALGS